MAGAAVALAGCGAQKQQAASAPTTTTTKATTQAAVDATSVSNLVWRSSIGDVKMVVMRPRDVAGALPVCLALHAEGADATQFVGLDLPPLLTATVRAGTKPFAIVAVDGGAKTWLGPAQKMLAEELPDWLARTELAATPFAALGVGGGAVGAFEYARTPGLSLLAAVSPAVYGSWDDARSSGIYANQQEWERAEPTRNLTAISSLPVSVWCGTEDPQYAAAREFADRARANPAAFSGGGHNADYWKRIMPEVLRFIGESLGKR
ncbi:hypothetical protein CLV40_10793 [Actinokineospora auranticolor]|uniref:Esterase n=2 Tax=Actinokineospora auranticolor TaxID=155976 RepID=A0A2S6GQG9_9PSEU|nr:hypothetical protein CLV40_10793 [Actinokineospora auranticolor]